MILVKTTSGASKKNSLPSLLISSILITLFLFFIDEGYYNFKWMSQIGNWIPFVVYVAIVFATQLFVSEVLLRGYRGKIKGLLTAIISLIGIIGIIYTFTLLL